jgi:hypothetical protein
MKRRWRPFSLLMAVWMAFALWAAVAGADVSPPPEPQPTEAVSEVVNPAQPPRSEGPGGGPTVTSPQNGDWPGAMPPRDVATMVQPNAATLGDLPSDFDRIEAGWIVLEFPSSVRLRVEPLVREAEELRARLSSDLGQPVLRDVLVRVARNPEQMAAIAPRGYPPFGYAAGMAYPSKHVVLLSLQAPETWEAPDLTELLDHELTHIALTDGVGGQHIPRWFDEGFAIHESGELPWRRFQVLLDASLSKHLIALPELDRAFPESGSEVGLAYAESADFVRFLMRDGDRARFGSLVQRVRAGVDFDRALEDAYGASPRVLEYQWREEVGHHVGLVPAVTGGGVLWVLIVALSVAAWARKRKRAREKLAQWAREEAEAAAAVAPPAPPLVGVDPTTGSVPPRIPAVPVVEHEGRWYTLH